MGPDMLRPEARAFEPLLLLSRMGCDVMGHDVMGLDKTR